VAVNDMGAHEVGVCNVGAHEVGVCNVGAHEVGVCNVGTHICATVQCMGVDGMYMLCVKTWIFFSNTSTYLTNLKGQSNEIFCLGLFYEWVSSKLLTLFLKAFRIWLRIRGNIRDFFIDSPLLFIAES
jgi:hypothetical protein